MTSMASAPPLDRSYVKSQELRNHYLELIKVKQDIEILLKEIKTTMDQFDVPGSNVAQNPRVTNTDWEQLNRLLTNYETIALKIDHIYHTDPDSYATNYNELTLVEKVLHPFRIIYKPFIKLIKWMSQTEGRIVGDDKEHGGENLGYLRELIEQMIQITSLTYKVEQRLQNTDIPFDDYFKNIDTEIDNIVNSIEKMHQPGAAFYELFSKHRGEGSGFEQKTQAEIDAMNPEEKLAYKKQEEERAINLENHWLYQNDDSGSETAVPVILRIKQIDDIVNRVLKPFMEGMQRKRETVGEANAYERLFTSTLLTPTVHQYLYNIIKDEQDINKFEILYSKEAYNQVDDSLRKINNVSDALLTKVNMDPTGILQAFGINLPQFKSLSQEAQKKIYKIIHATYNQFRIDPVKYSEEQRNVQPKKHEKSQEIKNFAEQKLNELLGRGEEDKKKAIRWIFHTTGPNHEEWQEMNNDDLLTILPPDDDKEVRNRTKPSTVVSFDSYKNRISKYNQLQRAAKNDDDEIKGKHDSIIDRRASSWDDEINNELITYIETYTEFNLRESGMVDIPVGVQKVTQDQQLLPPPTQQQQQQQSMMMSPNNSSDPIDQMDRPTLEQEFLKLSNANAIRRGRDINDVPTWELIKALKDKRSESKSSDVVMEERKTDDEDDDEDEDGDALMSSQKSQANEESQESQANEESQESQGSQMDEDGAGDEDGDDDVEMESDYNDWRVRDLREEAKKQGLNSRGKKTVLVQRLNKNKKRKREEEEEVEGDATITETDTNPIKKTRRGGAGDELEDTSDFTLFDLVGGGKKKKKKRTRKRKKSRRSRKKRRRKGRNKTKKRRKRTRRRKRKKKKKKRSRGKK
tara:strand:- start:1104 stop:3683 length:2580 start_codon:yes stop_codon:yes gene_type:complete